jgi:hypothetical protein
VPLPRVCLRRPVRFCAAGFIAITGGNLATSASHLQLLLAKGAPPWRDPEIAGDIQSTAIRNRAIAADSRATGTYVQEIASYTKEIPTDSQETGIYVEEIAADIQEMGVNTGEIAIYSPVTAAGSRAVPGNGPFSSISAFFA